MSKPVNEHKLHFEYYSPKAPYWSYDGLPFGGIYGVTLAALCGLIVQRGAVVFEHFLWMLFPIVFHVLLFLATQWSIAVRCVVRFNKEVDILKAAFIKVTPVTAAAKQKHKAHIVPIIRQGSDIYLIYEKKKYVFNNATSRFERLRYDIALSLSTYLNSVGLSSKQASEAEVRYGANIYDIPLPTFGELFKEHAVAPFFVFQIFCVLLWLMDEYWYYSLLTLFMLIVLEAQMVHRRLSDLSELRAMRIPPRPVHVFRDGNWSLTQSDHLMPGDIIALVRNPSASFPCDVLLLQGSVLVNEAMLTGESVPQMKVAASPVEGSPEMDAHLDIKGIHKQHIVSAGTNLMLHQNTGKTKSFKKVPTIGNSAAAVGYVLRTGFDTTQGKLCRTILFSAERITVSSREALYFLMILLAFAVGACCYVLYDGLVVAPTRVGEPGRSSFKLFLSVSHIITSVVPPEFPIMLSLAVNLSLVTLMRKSIFCTEPFRVPLAGKVETCCFDKTGTLTSDSMEVEGVYGLSDTADPLPNVKKDDDKSSPGSGGGLEQQLPFLTTAVMACCSGLTVVEGEVVGDPLERAALQAVKWLMIGPDVLTSKLGKGSERVQVLRRFPFVSELQRMSVLVRHQGPGLGHLQTSKTARSEHDHTLALVKGSCDVLKPRLKSVPSDFDEIQSMLTKSGLRVLCLAAKEVPTETSKLDPEQMNREDLESNLEFCGLLVLRNSIKPQVSSTIKQLRSSYHRVVMITGDHPLTACQVALHTLMSERPFLILEPLLKDAGDVESTLDIPSLEWRVATDSAKSKQAFVPTKVKGMTRKYSLCVPGATLSKLSTEQLRELAPFVCVFARVSPQQKEQVVTVLNQFSHTMMVGDGTNDVGALKHAHVGISLLSAPMQTLKVPVADARGNARNAQNAAMNMGDQAPLVRLGDASIASPFTYKGDSIKCSLQVLRCGRATLSTVLMMYKIMGLNSVLSAFAMSVLTLDGVKLGDGQTAVESLFTSMCFFLVSRSAPAKQLAKQQPICSVFAWSVLLSLALQLIVHLSTLLYAWHLANSFRPKEFKRDIEGEFEPNLTNSVVFQLMASMHASSFLANYEGHPFMQPLTENRPLLFSLIFFVTVLFTVASETIPELNSSLSLVVSPSAAFQQQLLVTIAVDIGLSVSMAKAVSTLAVRLRGRAAEKRAQSLGLGMGKEDKKNK